jgi:hypothetical protein
MVTLLVTLSNVVTKKNVTMYQGNKGYIFE